MQYSYWYISYVPTRKRAVSGNIMCKLTLHVKGKGKIVTRP